MRPVLRRPLILVLAGAAFLSAGQAGANSFDPHQNPPNLPRDINDWLTPHDRKEMRELPEDGSIQLENPPVFGWKSNRFRYSFEVKVERNGAPFLEFVTTTNLFRPDGPLPPGTYNWRVRQLDQLGRPLKDDKGGGWSLPRRFEVRGDAIVLDVPDLWTAFAAAEKRKRPRSIARSASQLSTGHAEVFDEIERRFRRESGQATSFDALRSRLSRASGSISRESEVRRLMRQVTRRINDALIVSVLSKDRRLRQSGADTALVLLRGLVTVDARGRTGHAGDDLLNIRVAKVVARAYDVLYRQMDGGLRAEVRRHVEDRTQAAFDFFLLNDHGNLAQFALSSHGFQIATHVLAISTLMAGDSDRAVLWFRETYPIVSTIVTPWGGDDGGYSNGINYGVWEFINHVDSWDIIQNTTGFQYFDTAWVRNFVEFLAYFTPPGVAQAGFGDGSEKLRPRIWAEIARLYLERGFTEFAGPLASGWRRHRQQSREDEDIINALVWPRLFGPGSYSGASAAGQSDIPDAAIFPDIGWGVVHSDLRDPNRYTVNFKSSQFGSFSHSHADQNSFSVSGRGKPLLIDSGYYDRYRSAHHNGWSRQTRAHNAITYDGGQGQPIDDPVARGRLTDYWRCSGVVKLTGQAAEAYGGDITRAERTLLYLPNGVLLVHDLMEAATAKQWEWNFHSLAPIRSDDGQSIRIRNGEGRLDLRVIAGPAHELKVTRGFDNPPDPRLLKDAADQNHGVFLMREKSRELTMLTAIRLGNGPSGPVSADEDENGDFSFRAGAYDGVLRPGQVHLRHEGRPLSVDDCAVPPRTLLAGSRLRLRQ